MAIDTPVDITPFARQFLEPQTATHRQYEALRAYFVEGLRSAEAAARFGYSPGSFRVLCHKFRQDPERTFFVEPKRGPREAPKTEAGRERAIALRKQNLSVYDISRVLSEEGDPLSPTAINTILTEEGFARLPRRREEDRVPGPRPDVAPVADCRELDLSERRFRTKFGGLFLFLPYLVPLKLDGMLKRAKFPGTKMIPAGHAMRSLLALKLFGSARHSHVMGDVFDEGLALFAGLNVTPKRSFLTEYSCRIHPVSHTNLLRSWFKAVDKFGHESGVSFDVDFHPIPFHGEAALVEKHYVSKRSRRQKAVQAFLAQDAERRVFCYGNTDLRRDTCNEEIVEFAKFWKKRTGSFPEEIVFDSKLTTYSRLNWLNQQGIRFITLRRRSPKMLEAIRAKPASAWRRVELEGVERKFRTPRIIDERVQLSDYEGPVRQITITDLGHEEPTLLLTNWLRRGPARLIKRYAQRTLIENGIADGVDFFHMDALSSAVALKVDCDMHLTLIASSLYRLLGARIGRGYATAKSRHLFQDFVNAAAEVTIGAREVRVKFQKRAHNPLLLGAGFADESPVVPWLGRKRLRLVFG
jgi:transposase